MSNSKPAVETISQLKFLLVDIQAMMHNMSLSIQVDSGNCMTKLDQCDYSDRSSWDNTD
jgi:hypothetical protein